MRVEVAYATPEKQWIIAVEVAEGATAREAVIASGLLNQCPEIVLDETPMGIFGVRIKTATTTTLHPGDRVELYRPLTVDPKESRRSRAESQKRDRQ